MRRLLESVDRAAATDCLVLIRGETGTGKGLVARRIHAASARRAGRFVELSCIGLGDDGLKQLGCEDGSHAGTLALGDGCMATAAGGTLFLDEVGELSLTHQANLLRILLDQADRCGGGGTSHMNCRLIVATHRDPSEMFASGRFREDLWYRIAVVTIYCPPLRDRGDDVDVLTDAILTRVAGRLGRRPPAFSLAARARWRAHRWPGNVRELENAIERILVLTTGATIDESDLPPEISGPPVLADGIAPDNTEVLTLHEAEKRAVLAALSKTKGKRGEAAALLGDLLADAYTQELREYGIRDGTDRR